MAWRESHAEVVLGMLLDDAEARGFTRIPLLQRLSLIGQGFAEHYSNKTVRFLAAVATGLMVLGMVLNVLPNLVRGAVLNSVQLGPALGATMEVARSTLAFGIPFLLTMMALSGFLCKVGWLGAGFRLLVNVAAIVAVVASTVSMWMVFKRSIQDVGLPAVDDALPGGIGVQLGYISMLLVPVILLVGLIIQIVRTRSGKLQQVLVAVFLLLVFAQLMLFGGGLFQGLAPILFIATFLNEKNSASWPGAVGHPRDSSRPHLVEWTHDQGNGAPQRE